MSDTLRVLRELAKRMRSEGPRYKSHPLGFVDSVAASTVDDWADELTALLDAAARAPQEAHEHCWHVKAVCCDCREIDSPDYHHSGRTPAARAEAPRAEMRRHARSCPASGNYQPPYEECDCGAESSSVPAAPERSE